MRKHASRIAIGLLIGAVIGLTALVVREGQIIQLQRNLIIDLWQFIQAGCPTPILN